MTDLTSISDADGIHGYANASDVRETDNVFARVREKGTKNDYAQIRVWRLSPLGVELVQSLTTEAIFSKGKSIDLQIVVEGHRSEISGTVVSVTETKHGAICGVRFLSERAQDEGTDEDNRTAMRWLCSEHHLPRAMASSPGRFNEFLGFQIRNISETGLMLVTDISNSFLIPKMRLTLSISLPMVGETVVECELVWLRIGTNGANDVLEIGAKLVDIGQRAKSLLGQYLVQFAQDLSIASLVEAGFTPPNIAQGIEFVSLKTESEYTELLALRAGGKGGLGVSHAQFAHESDRLSRIIIGKIGGNIVVSARVRYPELQEKLACESFLSWVDTLPRPDQLIEVDGICTSLVGEEKVLLALFKYICTACTSGSRKNVLVCTNEKKVFQSVGWKIIGESADQSVLLGDAHEAIKGKRTNPFKWNYVWRDSAQFLLATETFNPKGADGMILRIYLALGPLSKVIYKLKKLAR